MVTLSLNLGTSTHTALIDAFLAELEKVNEQAASACQAALLRENEMLGADLAKAKRELESSLVVEATQSKQIGELQRELAWWKYAADARKRLNDKLKPEYFKSIEESQIPDLRDRLFKAEDRVAELENEVAQAYRTVGDLLEQRSWLFNRLGDSTEKLQHVKRCLRLLKRERHRRRINAEKLRKIADEGSERTRGNI